MKRSQSSGFSTVESLITLFVGALLLAGGYQVYAIVTKSAQLARLQSSASNVGYELLHIKADQVPEACVASTEDGTSQIPTDAGLPDDSTAAITVTCPYGAGEKITQVSVTIHYFVDGEERTVVHALYTS